jgi:hypothetical protein
MTGPRLGAHFHVGIVVADLDAAQSELSEQLGISWGAPLRFEAIELRSGEGNDLVLPSSICYSVEEPRLELIEEVPGSVWSRNDHSNLHHIGYWSDDFVADGERLGAVGCPLQLCGRAGDTAPVSFSYHRSDLGVRVEIIDATMRPAIESMMFGPIGR